MPARTAAAAALGAGMMATATPAAAAEVAVPPSAVSWSAGYETAAAVGERWTQPRGVLLDDLVVNGSLTNGGMGCHSVWTRFTFDLAPAVPRKQAEVCGAGSVAVAVRQSYQISTTGSIAVCRGRASVANCAPWQLHPLAGPNPGPNDREASR